MTFLTKTFIGWFVAFFVFEKLIIGSFLYHSFSDYYYLYEVIFWTFTFVINYGVSLGRVGYFLGSLLRLSGIYFSSLCSYHMVILFSLGISSWMNMILANLSMVIFVPSCLPAVLIGLVFIICFDLTGVFLVNLMRKGKDTE